MGTGGYPDGAESNCGQCENGIYKFYERILKLFRFFRNFRFENAIVYHEAKGIRLAASVPPFICIDAGETRRYSRMEQSGSSLGP